MTARCRRWLEVIGSTRMDYARLDPARHLLFIAHLGDSAVIVFETQARKVVARAGRGLPGRHGVCARGALLTPAGEGRQQDRSAGGALRSGKPVKHLAHVDLQMKGDPTRLVRKAR